MQPLAVSFHKDGRKRRGVRELRPEIESHVHRFCLDEDELTYREAFSHGYLLSTGPSKEGIRGDWHHEQIGAFAGYFEPRTAYSITRGPSCDVLLVGQAVDIEHGSNDLVSIAHRIAAEYGSKGLEGAVRYVAYLGGRFTCHIRAGDTLTVIPDTAASQSTYWYQADGECTLSTHAYLLALNRRLPVNPLFEEAIAKRKGLQPKYTIHAPALLTPFVGVLPVLANCLLSVTSSGDGIHRRFYPFDELPKHDFDKTYPVFQDLFAEHTRLLADLGCIGISLTGGVDSQSTLAVARKVSSKQLCLAFNYIDFESADSAAHNDLYLASQSARKAELAFTIARIDRQMDNDRFRPMFCESFPRGAQAPRIARALYEDVPHGIYEFASTVAEIGSAFYKLRNKDLWNPATMASTYGHSAELGQDRGFQFLFNEYAEYGEFTRERTMGLDPYDLFYWEHRMTRWAANRYHEIDLGHRVVLPYNSRAVIEAMLSVPLESRVSKDFQKRLVLTHPL